jgi:hypothetical protein
MTIVGCAASAAETPAEHGPMIPGRAFHPGPAYRTGAIG